MAYGIHVGSHICLVGGVIYTLGVNDRGSHLCLGVIYASDTGFEPGGVSNVAILARS